jgi:hypothetical protein
MEEKIGQFIIGIFAVITGIILLGLVSTLNGTLLWLLYPHIFDMFPKAAEAGVLSPTLGWWSSVCITWVFGLLIKSSNTNTNNKEK